MELRVSNGDGNTNIKLRKVLYAPMMGATLVSVGQIDAAGYATHFQNGKCIIQNKQGRLIGSIPRINNLYHIDGGTEALVAGASEVSVATAQAGHFQKSGAVSQIQKLKF
jgi:hypothetical protein